MYRAFQNLPRLSDFQQAMCCNLQLVGIGSLERMKVSKSPDHSVFTELNIIQPLAEGHFTLQVWSQVLSEESRAQVEVQALCKRAGGERKQGKSGRYGRQGGCFSEQ